MQKMNDLDRTPIDCAPFVSRDAQDLIRSILKLKPENRPSFPELFTHKWML